MNEDIKKSLEEIFNILEGNEMHISWRVAIDMIEDFTMLIAIDFDMLLKDLRSNHLGCQNDNCALCALVTKQQFILVEFMRKVLEPHKTEALEIFEKRKQIHESTKKLMDEITKHSGNKSSHERHHGHN